MNSVLRLGTRGSALALWQANWVADRLRATFPAVSTELVVVRTTGDARQDIPLPEMAGKGVFVREIETALLHGEIDIAVHSAKDLQSTDPFGLTTAAFCAREDARDALIAPRWGVLGNLPRGARVATGSPRRQAQLRRVRPDLHFVEIRGNVDTRLAKLANGAADALVLAVAGLVRLGRTEVITRRLPIAEFLPQVGQASVAVQCRADDPESIDRVRSACDHAPTHRAVAAERTFLSRLGGGCTAPVAAHAIVEADVLWLRAFVAAPDGSAWITADARSGTTEETDIGETVYRQILLQNPDLLGSET